MLKASFVGGVAVLGLASTGFGATLSPTADVGIQSPASNGNEVVVDSDRLLVKNQNNQINDRVSLVRFDGSALTGGSVVDASLTFTISAISSAPATANLQLFGIPNASAHEAFDGSAVWSDLLYNATTSPSGLVDQSVDNNVFDANLGATPLATYAMPNTVAVGDEIVFQSQELVDFLNANDNGHVSFVLTTTTVHDQMYLGFYSTENTGGAAAMLTYTVPEPASLAMIGLGGLALVSRRRRA